MWHSGRVHFFDEIPHMYDPPEISSEKKIKLRFSIMLGSECDLEF